MPRQTNRRRSCSSAASPPPVAASSPHPAERSSLCCTARRAKRAAPHTGRRAPAKPLAATRNTAIVRLRPTIRRARRSCWGCKASSVQHRIRTDSWRRPPPTYGLRADASARCNHRDASAGAGGTLAMSRPPGRAAGAQAEGRHRHRGRRCAARRRWLAWPLLAAGALLFSRRKGRRRWLPLSVAGRSLRVASGGESRGGAARRWRVDVVQTANGTAVLGRGLRRGLSAGHQLAISRPTGG